MTCLHLLLLNLVQHGQLAVLCLLTPWEPCSACPGLPCSWERPRDAGNWGISPGWEQTGVQRAGEQTLSDGGKHSPAQPWLFPLLWCWLGWSGVLQGNGHTSDG